MFDNFSKVYVSVEDLAVRIMHVDPDRLLFMFDERILIFLKSDSFYLPSVKTPKIAANPLKKTEIRRYTTEVPAFRPFFQRYGWTLCNCLKHDGAWISAGNSQRTFLQNLGFSTCVLYRYRTCICGGLGKRKIESSAFSALTEAICIIISIVCT